MSTTCMWLNEANSEKGCSVVLLSDLQLSDASLALIFLIDWLTGQNWRSTISHDWRFYLAHLWTDFQSCFSFDSFSCFGIVLSFDQPSRQSAHSRIPKIQNMSRNLKSPQPRLFFWAALNVTTQCHATTQCYAAILLKETSCKLVEIKGRGRRSLFARKTCNGPAQLICISDIYYWLYMSTDKYKKHSRVICYGPARPPNSR